MNSASRREGLAVVRLTLNDFRCYSFLRMEVDRRPVILVGGNGAGKTNILEALSFLTPGRGLRRAKLSEITRQGAAETASWAVAARLVRQAEQGPGERLDEVDAPGSSMVEIGTGREVGSERRIVQIDGRPARSQASLSDVASALWLTPAMDRLFSDSASGRRRFLDRLVLGQDAAHAARASAYDNSLRQRIRLLKEGRFDPAWLDMLEETMAGHGVAMAAARRQAVADLNEACKQRIGPFPAAVLMVTGKVEDVIAETSVAEAEIWFRKALAQNRRADAESGGTIIGPHRSDLLVRHGDKDQPAELCSTGEQKAVLVAIVLSQARIQALRSTGAPILLLDEVTAHLDRTRRIALFDELCALPAQSWLTGTDSASFAEFGERGQFFCVEDGAVRPA